MNKRADSKMIMMLFVVGVLSNAITAITDASPTTTFYVDPASVDNPSLTPGSIFSVDVKVSAAFFLYSWQVFMSWDSAVLEYSSHVFGRFLDDQPEGMHACQRIEEEWLLVAETSKGMHPGKSADEGVLVTVTFSVLDIGDTVLNLDSRVVFGDETDLTYYFECFGSPELIRKYPVRENGYFSNFGVHETMHACTEVEELGFEGEIDNQGTVASLLAKLNVAQKLIDDGKIDQAKNILDAFINEVQAQSGKHITLEAADILIQSAGSIISSR